MDQRPLLFVDVDGPLNPYARSRRSAYRDGYRKWRANGFEVLLKHGHGAALTALPYELVWATTWGHEANVHIAPRIGLPKLPVCEFPVTGNHAPGLHAKTPGIVEYAGGRPFAWVDDEITRADRDWADMWHPGPVLLHRADPARGLTAKDFEVLAEWVVPGWRREGAT
ncbi:hypothetical protein KIK06_07510 [Nocardiopsis sp. EMB25]|uniref:hypothetical protein n=1 Tax=Nocardiopsis sp. EMB25 TaxID=2835867 RepID=UPI002284DA67|nr:hypothetical protein [Nocardiopsis sp. EMB25]MCY9783737.1 hypothetical protein [Nocardiopsis sp. EMB25]